MKFGWQKRPSCSDSSAYDILVLSSSLNYKCVRYGHVYSTVEFSRPKVGKSAGRFRYSGLMDNGHPLLSDLGNFDRAGIRINRHPTNIWKRENSPQLWFLLTLVYNSRHDVIGTTKTCAIHTYTQEEAQPKCQLISQSSPRVESICPLLIRHEWRGEKNKKQKEKSKIWWNHRGGKG